MQYTINHAMSIAYGYPREILNLVLMVSSMLRVGKMASYFDCFRCMLMSMVIHGPL